MRIFQDVYTSWNETVSGDVKLRYGSDTTCVILSMKVGGVVFELIEDGIIKS